MLRKKLHLASLIGPFLTLFLGCDRTQSLQSVKKAATPANSTSSIVIDVGENLAILHEAQAGQTLEWRSDSPGTPNFWIQFVGPSPCTSGALVLSGSATKVASCVAANGPGGNATVTYSYYVLATQPAPLPPPTATGDRIARCLGCNN